MTFWYFQSSNEIDIEMIFRRENENILQDNVLRAS